MSNREYRKRCRKALRDQRLTGLGAILLTLIFAVLGWTDARDAAMCTLPMAIPIMLCGFRGKIVYYI